MKQSTSCKMKAVPMDAFRDRRRAVVGLVAIVGAAAFGLWLRQGILRAPVGGAPVAGSAVKWSAGRTAQGDPLVFQIEKTFFRSGDPSIPYRTLEWRLVAGWCYLCRYEVPVELR